MCVMQMLISEPWKPENQPRIQTWFLGKLHLLIKYLTFIQLLSSFPKKFLFVCYSKEMGERCELTQPSAVLLRNKTALQQYLKMQFFVVSNPLRQRRERKACLPPIHPTTRLPPCGPVTWDCSSLAMLMSSHWFACEGGKCLSNR